MNRHLVECEYDAQSNQLISMAIVPIKEGAPQPQVQHEFYQALEVMSADMHSWVVENVLPVRNIDPVDFGTFTDLLCEYIVRERVGYLVFTSMHGLAQFATVLTTASVIKKAIPGPMHLEYQPYVVAGSEIPNNALEDARGQANAIFYNERSNLLKAMAH